MDVTALADLLHETAEHNDGYAETHPKPGWLDWNAPYLSAREDGSTPEEASNAAGHYIEEVLHVLPR